MVRFFATSLLAVVLIGCNMEPSGPSDLNNKNAENRTKTDPTTIEVTGDLLDEMFPKKNTEDKELPNDPSPHIGQTALITGKIARIRSKTDTDDPAQHGAVCLNLTHPDSKSINVECFFAAEHEPTVRSQRLGNSTRIRGQIQEVSNRTLRLVGCTIESTF